MNIQIFIYIILGLFREVNDTLTSEGVFLVYAILFFLSFSVLFTLLIFYSRITKTIKENKTNVMKKKYQLLITSYMFDEGLMANGVESEQIQKMIAHYNENYLQNKFNRNVLIEEILLIYKELSGDAAENLRKLYLTLDLEKDSLKKVESTRWYIQAKGVKELAEMNISSAYPIIYALINHPNKILRMEVHTAIVKLVNFSALTFLDESKYPISEWQQINILEVLSKSGNTYLPDFSQWLGSRNDSVVLFALKMVKFFHRIDHIKQILKLLKHDNLKIRKDVVDTIGELDAASALSTLKKQFYSDEKEFKLEVLRVSKKIAIEKDLPFLEVQLLNEDYDISLASANAMVANGEMGVTLLKDISKTYADDKLKGIIRQAFSAVNMN